MHCNDMSVVFLSFKRKRHILFKKASPFLDTTFILQQKRYYLNAYFRDAIDGRPRFLTSASTQHCLIRTQRPQGRIRSHPE